MDCRVKPGNDDQKSAFTRTNFPGVIPTWLPRT
jgi:hypothetical protein